MCKIMYSMTKFEIPFPSAFTHLALPQVVHHHRSPIGIGAYAKIFVEVHMIINGICLIVNTVTFNDGESDEGYKQQQVLYCREECKGLAKSVNDQNISVGCGSCLEK